MHEIYMSMYALATVGPAITDFAEQLLQSVNDDTDFNLSAVLEDSIRRDFGFIETGAGLER